MAAHSSNADSKPNLDLKIVVGVLIAGLVAFHLGLTLSGRPIMREQHLGTAVTFAKQGIDLLHPILTGANANGVPMIMEFPLWQAITASFMKFFGVWYGWGNVVSLISHLSGLWPLYYLGKRIVPERVVWWGLAFYLAQPLTWIWGGMAGVDSMSAATALWFVHLSCSMLESGNWWRWAMAAITAVICATMKLPFFMAAGLVSVFYLLHKHRASWKAWGQLSSVGIIATTAFYFWNRHTNYYYELAEFPFYDLRLTGRNSYAYGWWFGNWERLSQLKFWARAFWHLAIVFFGAPALLLLPLLGGMMPEAKFLRWWLAAGVLTTCVFTNVILVHYHYHFIFSAPVVFMAAQATAFLESRARQAMAIGWPVRQALLLFFFCGCVAQGLVGVKLRYYADDYAAKQAAIIKEHTAPTDKLIVFGQDWGTPFMHAERDGLSMLNLHWLNQGTNLVRLKQLGYTHLVLMNKSPVEVAASTVSGGGTNVRMLDLSMTGPENIRGWPIVFNSTQLRILRLP